MKLWEAARAKVRAKGYVSDLKELDAIIGKVNEGVELDEHEAHIMR